MPKNLLGQDMRFQFLRPIITNHEVLEFEGLLKNIPSLEFQVTQETVEHVLELAGRLMVAGQTLPLQMRQWWEGVDSPMKLLVDCCTAATISNAYYIHTGIVERAIFARVALKWLECFIDES